MSPTGGGSQYNSTNSGNLYATQTGNININNPAAGRRGPRIDSKVLVITLLADAIFFLYGMLVYSGKNTEGDQWRAGIFLFLFFWTCVILGRWVRRRI